jgi:hypothetical protein
MKVLFQKPRWATATRKVSAPAVCAVATAHRPTNAARTRFMALSLNLPAGIFARRAAGVAVAAFSARKCMPTPAYLALDCSVP